MCGITGQKSRPWRIVSNTPRRFNLTESASSSFDVRHQLFNTAALSVECFEKRVWAGLTNDGLKGQTIPDAIKHKLVLLAEPAAADQAYLSRT